MSRDPRKIFDEARKKGGYPLMDQRTGHVAIVPAKIMRCPTCGSKPRKKEASKAEDRLTPEGLQIFICDDCHTEFAQVKKRAYCEHFKRSIAPEECRRCPVGAPYLKEIARKLMRGEPLDKDQQICPHFKPRIGMDYLPEGWERDNQFEG